MIANVITSAWGDWIPNIKQGVITATGGITEFVRTMLSAITSFFNFIFNLINDIAQTTQEFMNILNGVKDELVDIINLMPNWLMSYVIVGIFISIIYVILGRA